MSTPERLRNGQHTGYSAQRGPRTEQAAFSLPTAPTDVERDMYFGPQHRWVPFISFISSLAVVLSIWLFMSQRAWASFLALPVAISAAGAIISVISASRERRYSYADHRAAVENWTPDYLPSVDVFLPTAGEPIALLTNTYRHVSQLQWPAELQVHVLDDADRPEVAALAQEFGFTYVVRPNRGHMKKAGNLLHAFQHSAGDLILVLDADFVPRPDALYELAPYLDDPKIAIVQSPQYFDMTDDMSSLQRAAGATQILFYRWVQPSRDRSNAAICVGTSALYRREALEKAGGFAQIGHSEDVHTGVKLMGVGYLVRYIPTVVTKGICPDKFDSFVTQQYRWCSGSMSLLLSRSFHRQRFTFMQRLSYWSGFLYYISTGINVFTLAIPPVLMALFAPGAVNPTNYALVVFALGVRLFVIPIITMGRASMNAITRVQMTYSFSHAVALFDQVRKRSDAWVATGTGARSVTAVRVGKVSRRWCIAVQVALWALVLWRIPEYGIVNYGPLVVLTLLNLWLVIPIIARRDVKWVK